MSGNGGIPGNMGGSAARDAHAVLHGLFRHWPVDARKALPGNRLLDCLLICTQVTEVISFFVQSNAIQHPAVITANIRYAML